MGIPKPTGLEVKVPQLRISSFQIVAYSLKLFLIRILINLDFQNFPNTSSTFYPLKPQPSQHQIPIQKPPFAVSAPGSAGGSCGSSWKASWPKPTRPPALAQAAVPCRRCGGAPGLRRWSRPMCSLEILGGHAENTSIILDSFCGW